MIAVVAAHVRCRWRLINRDRRTMAGRCFIQINIHAGDSVFAIVLVVSPRIKKLLGRTETRTRDRVCKRDVSKVEEEEK